MAVRRGKPALSVLIVVVQLFLLNLELTIVTIVNLLAVVVVQHLLNLELTFVTMMVVQLLQIHLRMVDLTMLNLNAVQVQRDLDLQQQQLLLFVTLEQCIVKACPVEGVGPNLGKMGLGQTA